MASFVWYYYDPEMMLYYGIICVLVWYEILKLCQYQGDLGHHSGSAPRQAYGPSPGDLDADNDYAGDGDYEVILIIDFLISNCQWSGQSIDEGGEESIEM